MHASKLAALFVLISSFALAAPPPATPGEAPISVKYRVLKPGSTDVTLLSGEIGVVPFRPTGIEHKGRGSEQQKMTLEVTPVDDGRIMVRVGWDDRSADGEEVQWQPTVVVKRGGEIELKLEFPGGSRVLRLTAG